MLLYPCLGIHELLSSQCTLCFVAANVSTTLSGQDYLISLAIRFQNCLLEIFCRKTKQVLDQNGFSRIYGSLQCCLVLKIRTRLDSAFDGRKCCCIVGKSRVPCGMNQSLYCLTGIVAHMSIYAIRLPRPIVVCICTICSARLNGCVAFAFRNPSVCR
jgi:hypothetical protein